MTDSKVKKVLVEKASIAAAATAESLFMTGTGVQTPKDEAAWIELYGRLVWVYAGIYTIGSTVAQLVDMIKLRRRKRVKGKEQIVEDMGGHRILDLLVRPNPNLTGYDLFESLMVYLETAGRAYWEEVYKVVGKTGVKFPSELYPIRPTLITPVPDKGGRGIKQYDFQTKKYQKKIIFSPDQIVPFKYFNPTNEWIGQGSVQPASDEIGQDQHQVAWNKDFFSHGATPDGVLESDKMITRADVKNVKEMFDDMVRGKGRATIVLGKGLKYHALTLGPKDTEFLEGRHRNMIAMLSALGVPPAKVGVLTDTKYASYHLQEQAFYRDTIIPKLRKVEGAMNNFLLPNFPSLASTDDVDYYLEFDTTELFREDDDALNKRIMSQVEHGLLTLNQAAEKLGLEPWDEGDIRVLDGRLQVVGAEAAVAEIEEQEEAVTKALDGVEQMVQKMKGEFADRLGALEDVRRGLDE